MKFFLLLSLLVASTLSAKWVIRETRGPECKGGVIRIVARPLGCVPSSATTSTDYECRGPGKNQTVLTHYNGTTCGGTPYLREVVKKRNCDEEGASYRCGNFPAPLTAKDVVYVFYREPGCPTTTHNPSSIAVFKSFGDKCMIDGKKLEGSCFNRTQGSEVEHCGKGFNYNKFFKNGRPHLLGDANPEKYGFSDDDVERIRLQISEGIARMNLTSNSEGLKCGFCEKAMGHALKFTIGKAGCVGGTFLFNAGCDAAGVWIPIIGQGPWQMACGLASSYVGSIC